MINDNWCGLNIIIHNYFQLFFVLDRFKTNWLSFINYKLLCIKNCTIVLFVTMWQIEAGFYTQNDTLFSIRVLVQTVLKFRLIKKGGRKDKQQAVLAQPVERMAFNHVVVGSIPTDGVFSLILGLLCQKVYFSLKRIRHSLKKKKIQFCEFFIFFISPLKLKLTN